MALTPGSRLGPYEILSALGAGGMGEVYRAHDTKLDRDVAVKILPEAFAADADRVARFQREAKSLAALNHPNIGAIYGLEQAGGIHALVMELAEGEDLSQRIARGAIPVDEALPIAKQVAEALEAAHEHGIIHRDLKPANIKVRADGTVKVLDFGLAKAMVPTDVASPNVSQSPTITTPAMTQAGMILGTAAYMSPEQAKGRAADKRSDVWAFGCVLFEMLTGMRSFDGEDVSETLASVLKTEPNWTALPADTPPAIRTLLRGCFKKDRRQRIGDISAALFVLDEAASLTSPSLGDAASAATGASVLRLVMWRRVAVFSAAALALGGALAASLTWLVTRPTAPRVTRTTIVTTGAAGLTVGRFDRDVAVTPDGTRVIYTGDNGTQLFVRSLDQLEPKVLVTGTPRGVFTSPDNQWIGYVESDATLKKVALAGGPPATLLAMDGLARGAAWLPDDTIIFATTNLATGLQRVAVAGGTPTVLTRPNRDRGELDHLWPEPLPGGKAVLFTITPVTGGLDAAQVALLDLTTGVQQTLVHGGSHAQYVSSGHLVYTAGGSLQAVPFDLARRTVRGTPAPVLTRVVTKVFGAADVAVAADGTLVYVDAPGGLPGMDRTLVWVDRHGQEQALGAPLRAYTQVRLSPDGTRVALYCEDEEQDIWIWDLEPGGLTRLTFDPGVDQNPVWTKDGQRLVFASQRDGVFNLFWQAADNTGMVERLTKSPNQQFSGRITPDGTALVFSEVTPTTGWDQMLLTLTPPWRVTPLLSTRSNERDGSVSPNGHWLAYSSDSSGRYEIFVRPYPKVESGQWQVTTAGGIQPRWSRSGDELFYAAPDGALMVVPVEPRTDRWNKGTPRELFNGRYFVESRLTYDVSPDGQRFLMIKKAVAAGPAAPPQIVVVSNWGEELKRLVPVK